MTEYSEQIEFASLIKAMRFRLGMTQADFATRLGVRQLAVSTWENGHHNPSRLSFRSIDQELVKMGDRGRDLLEKYFETS